ncbi:MAG: hypothetical protein HY720_23185 [Planctomycetes bacterium]|nr:hypothetical protein [Planctomycetota bacterium]
MRTAIGTLSDMSNRELAAGERDLEAESDLVAIALLLLALSGAWLLFGLTIFSHEYGKLAALLSSVVSLAHLAAAWTIRGGRRYAAWLVTSLAPWELTLLAGLARSYRWELLPDGAFLAYLFAAQGILLLAMVGWSVYRVHTRDVRRLAEPSYADLHGESPDGCRGEGNASLTLPAPFPVWAAASVLVWLLFLFAFLLAFARSVRGV